MKEYKRLEITIIVWLIILLIIVPFIFAVMPSNKPQEADYQLIVEVYQTCGDTHLLRDTSGNVWSIKADLDNSKRYIIGMSTNGTNNIYDDSIVTIDEWRGVE